MEYVLITSDKIKYILDENEYKGAVEAIARNDKVIVLRGSVIPLHITPLITPFEVWFSQESERLALTHHRLCKKCFCIMATGDDCTCWERSKGENKNAFGAQLPEMVKQTLKEIAAKKAFPKVEVLEPADSSRLSSGSDDGGDYYLDENGEKCYQ